MGEANRTSEARMRAAAQAMVTALDTHGDVLNRVEAIAVLGTVVGTFALAWGGEAEVVNGVGQVARALVEGQRAKARDTRPAHVQEWLETLGPWHHDENWQPLDTPAIRAAVPTVKEVYRHNGVGGNLHVVVDDYNVLDDSLAACAKWIEEDDRCSEAQRRAERACLAALTPLTPEERASAIRLAE